MPIKNLLDLTFADALNAICETGEIEADAGYLRFSFPSDLLKRPITDAELSPRAQHALCNKQLYPKPKRDDPEEFTIGKALEFPSFAKIRGCGEKTAKEIRTGIISYVYKEMSSEQKEQFWLKFLKENAGVQ